MFGNKKTLADRLKEVLTEYIDTKFEEYRGQISNELSKGIAALAALVAIWSLIIIGIIFISFTTALILGWVLSGWIPGFAYQISFLTVSMILIAIAYFILKNKKKYIVKPVYEIISKELNNPEYVPEAEITEVEKKADTVIIKDLASDKKENVISDEKDPESKIDNSLNE